MASGDPPENLCFFGKHLLRATTAVTEYVDCDGVHSNFLSIDDLKLRETIMARCCLKFIDQIMINSGPRHKESICDHMRSRRAVLRVTNGC